MTINEFVDYFLAGLRNKSDDVKIKSARELKHFLINELKDKSHEEMINFIDKIFNGFIEMTNSSDMSDRKSVLISLGCIIDLDFIYSHNSYGILTTLIQEMPITADIQVSALQARLIAQMNLISSPERVESQIKESCSILADESKSEHQRIFAALLFKEISLYASTVFFPYATRVIKMLMTGIRDKQASVREVCAIALANAFAVTAAREGIGRRRQKMSSEPSNQSVAVNKLMGSISGLQYQKQLTQQPVNQIRSNDANAIDSGKVHMDQGWSEELYNGCIKVMLDCYDDQDISKQMNTRKLNQEAWNHGTLLLLNELLKLSNDELEMNRIQLELMIGLPLDQLTNSTVPVGVSNVRSLCKMELPYSNMEQHILQHRSKMHTSQSCRQLLQSKIEPIRSVLIQNFTCKQPYLIQLVMHAIPRFSALEGSSPYITEYLEFLQRCIKKERDKPLAYLTIGFLAHIAPFDFEKNSFLDKTLVGIKQNLPGKDVSIRKRQPLLEICIYFAIALISTGFKQKVHDVIKDMIETMVEVGLSFPLIYSLKTVSRFIPELTPDIQSTLLKSLRKTLMNSSRMESKKPQLNSSISIETEIPLSNCLLSPLITNLSSDQMEARNKIIALRTLVEFDFDKHNLSLFVRFISSKLISFISCPYKEVRLEAVKTCAQLLTPLLGSDDAGFDRNTLTAVADVLEKLLIVSTSDPEKEVRLCVFQSFDERFDAYLAQECHLSPLFVAFHDEMFEIRKLVIRCLGRLSAINPSCLKPNLRKILLQTLTELEYSGSSRSKEQAAQILAELIDTAPRFIQPHSEKLLLVLLPRIQSIIYAAQNQPAGQLVSCKKSSFSEVSFKKSFTPPSLSICQKTSLKVNESFSNNEPTAVQLAIIQAIKNLAVVCGSKLKKHLNDLVPSLIYMMQDSTSLDKRFVAVTTLTKLVTHTGYVVEPYRKYPELLHLLLTMLRTEEVGSIRREVIKLLGTIGALDPFKQKTFCSDIDSVSDTGLVVSMHEVIEKKEVDMSQAELLVNITWKNLDEFYVACALQSLIQLLRDPTYRSNYEKICSAIISIFRTLGPGSVQYLKQVLPEYFRCIIESQDIRHQETFLAQLCFITDIVKLHLKQFMPELVDIFLQLWHKSSSLTLVCINLLRRLNIGLGADIKPFLSPLMVVFQQTIVDAAYQSVRAILELLPEFEHSIEEHVHILLPSIIKLISKDTSSAKLEIKKAALDCLTRLAEKLDLSDSAGRIVQPVCRLLDSHDSFTFSNSQSISVSQPSIVTNLSTDQLAELIPPAFDLLTTLLVKMRRRFMVLTPLIQKTLETIKYQFPTGTAQSLSFSRFNTALNKVLKVTYVHNYEDNFEHFESLARRKHLETISNDLALNNQSSMVISFSSQSLEKTWEATEMISSEDWMQWLRNFSITLIKESPSMAIRSCSNLGGCTGVLSRNLFNASFVSCWPELTDVQQDKLIVTLEGILKDCPSTEVSQAVLNLEEFMTHCDRMKLPIKTEILACRALKNRVYAKALYYKEQEFLEETAKKGVAPQNLLFDLLTINNKLQLEEAASGIVLYATKIYRDKLLHEERWHEILQDWTRALNLYQRKLEENDTRRIQNIDLTLGRMRCLQALGDWDSLKNIGIDRFEQVEETVKIKMAPMLVNAAWAKGDFLTMCKFVESIPLNNFEGPFLRAVISIQKEEYNEASDYIQKARDELDSYLTAMAGESYIRAYSDLVEAQKLAELEEVIQYKLVKESQETIKQAWVDRLKGCQQAIDDWRQLLQIRSLVLKPNQDMTTWLKFAGLARRNNRMDMAKSIMEHLYGGDLTKCTENSILSCQFPQIIFSWAKYQWTLGQQQSAVNNLELLVEHKLKSEIFNITNDRINNIQTVEEFSLKNLRKLLAKCALRLGDWYTESQTKGSDAQHREVQCRIVNTYRIATEESPEMKRAWQAWAMANYASICLAKSRLVEVTRQMTAIARKWKKMQPSETSEVRRVSTNQNVVPNIPVINPNGSIPLPIDVSRMAQPQLRFTTLQTQQKRNGTTISFPATTLHVPASKSTFGPAVAVRAPDNENALVPSVESSDAPIDAALLQTRYLELEKQRKALISEREKFSRPAVQGFINAISLSPCANLQDSLRLVILLFQFGHDTRIREIIQDGLSKISLENWLLVIQQLLARIDTHKEHVSSIIVGLLITVGERHPQAMVNPLVLAFKSGGSDRRRYNANKILHSMEIHSARLVSEAFLLNEELIRLAISWMEMWTECLEDASRLHYEEKNTAAMFKILYPLHLLMEREIETLHEVSFYNEYYGDLSSAKNLCMRFESSNFKTDLTQAWEIYSNLYRKWNKQISNVSTLELSVASPRLHDYNDWILAVPGSYDPNRPIVKINSIKNCLNLMTSKQHPRKLTIIGSDGHNYMFLLKGHEDIRQDERAMQFFGLINTLLVSNRHTSRINLSIQRMSVIPLSTNTGLIGWVPNSDTLNAVIRDYREKTGVLLNREHKEMLKIAPDFEKLNIIQKTEVFEAGIKESDGKDLAHILWLKSHNSEAWFERRTNFIRSLAVMSMVGYILGLGDRHPSNIMLCRDSGKIIHIDFGDCFEVATMREKYPEKVPFRLTRMLIGAMEVTGIDGLFRHTSVQIVNLMRRNKDSLLAVLEAFIHDPLLQWVLHDNTKKGGENTIETDENLFINQEATNDLRKALKLGIRPFNVPAPPTTIYTNMSRNPNSRPSSGNTPINPDCIRIFSDSNYPDSKTLRNPYSVNQWRHHLCNGPWLGCYNTALKMRKRAPDGSIIVERNGLEGLIFSAKPPITDRPNFDDTEDEWAGANVRAMDVMKHIQNKLEGKESGGSLSAEEHVDMLIKQATFNYNLCQMYFGWCAFW